jgi:hypothetical protein
VTGHDIELYTILAANDVTPAEIAQLGDAQAGSVERVEDRVIARHEHDT